ncbi:MAG: bifunctional phosphoribosyl-AMP cyclohydrolase/phosphoribosyl-ATP diphosphatase HisIE [Chitinophagaceae bacterium]|nr:bifunctional phosphoribosyl-AMP cyclohydrolase/phosphoribosyl-ATP diphosphatase HisIE [Chitinophagaceae bacterium]
MMKPDFSKYSDLLVPAIIQDELTDRVLMLGYMNEKALQQTEETGKVTFYSRSKQRLWTKGESSGNYLYLKSILMDCDADCLLIKACPAGPVCHSGSDTCFNESNPAFNLAKLEAVIKERKDQPAAASYTSSLFAKGINKIAQKVGEEAVELVIESKDNDREKFLGEAADLLFHYLVLLQAKGSSLDEVIKTLAVRHK